jgi:potassium-transporting ATPase KdpC subunit
MLRQLKTALILLVIFTVITGIIYPLFITGIAQAFLHRQANGSLIEENGNTVGSELIGQPFSGPEYFWGRLSATATVPYNAAASSGSNYGPSNPALREAVRARIDALEAVDPDNNEPVPADLVTFSGSGLDPDISLAAADYQVTRVARHRGLGEQQVRDLVEQYTEGRQLGILGEPRVNVLQLNLALDRLE